jgi:hypothetical protein
MFNSSSTTKQVGQADSDNINLSLKRGTNSKEEDDDLERKLAELYCKNNEELMNEQIIQ